MCVLAKTASRIRVAISNRLVTDSMIARSTWRSRDVAFIGAEHNAEHAVGSLVITPWERGDRNRVVSNLLRAPRVAQHHEFDTRLGILRLISRRVSFPVAWVTL
jgi:hypothetical protein